MTWRRWIPITLVTLCLWHAVPGLAQEPRLLPGTTGKETRLPAEEAQRKASELLTALTIKTQGPLVCTAKPIDPSANVHVFVCNTTAAGLGEWPFHTLTIYCDAGTPTMVCWIPPAGGF